jgi:hypothetical protein
MNLETLFCSRKRLFFALACALFAQTSGLFAQGVQIHTKPARSTPASSDLLILEDASNTTWKIRLDQIAAFVGTLSGAGDASTNTITSVDGEIVLFSGTTGKILKRGNTLNGILKYTAGVPVSAVAHKDFASDTAQTGSDANNTWTAGVTSFAEGVALTLDRTLPLPATTDFADGSVIRLTDTKTTGNFGRLMTPSGSDTLNGVGSAAWVTAGYYQPFKAGGYGGASKVRYFEKRGTNWQSVGDAAAVLYFQKQGDPTGRVVPDMTNVPSGIDIPFVMPGSPFTGLIPSDSSDNTQTVVTGGDVDGLHYSTIQVVPTTALHAIGDTLQITSDGNFDFAPVNTGSASYQILNNSTNPVVWNCVAGTKQQNAILTMPAGNRAIQVNGASSGFEFNLFVKQDATGGRTITALPTGSVVGGGGAGIPTLTSAANAIDWIKGTYTGQSVALWGWGVFQANMTAAAPPTCATAGVTGATTGTVVVNQSAANKAYIANNFIADATSICRFDANLQTTGAPNYDVKAFVCPDAIRITFTAATTTNGSNTVQFGAAGIATGDVGQAITGPGIPANTYVGTVSTATQSVTLSSSRTSNVSVNAGGGAGTGTVAIYGAPGSPINATGSDPVNTTAMPLDASSTAVTFTNVGVSGLTVGANYHLVLGTSAAFGTAAWDASNYMVWLQGAGNTTGFHVMRSSTLTGGTWTINNDTKKQRWASFH